MKNVKISKLWDQLHSSYWFIPAVMAVGATALAFTMLNLDRTGKVNIDYWWVYGGGADGARSLLGSVAGSMISVAATAFSITIVALQLAASNFGPRLLRNFMQDTGNQVVLGTFIGTFIYCLFVLRTIRGEGDGYEQYVPQLSVTVGTLLAIISIGVLIYFIHHASTIIQASHVIENVSEDLHSAIKRLFPERIGHGEPEHRLGIEEIPMSFEKEALPIRANGTGYLQAIDNGELMKIACKHNLLIRLKVRPGKFLIQGSDLALVFPGKKVNKKLTKQINDAFILGKERTEQQDIEFPIDQLVEIALRAISPGINDPFTAIRCIDRISAGLCHLVQRDFPSPYRYDKNKKLRFIAEGVDFQGLVDRAFNQIRQYGKSDAGVTIRLLEAIAVIATYTNNSKYQVSLHHHADMILQDSREGLSQEQDYKDVEESYYQVIKNLNNNDNNKNWN
ncbi:DUF2254 domain-containing protein [Nostoc sp. UCD121]|uniref:DUF2254 domain-containing protein n=1 Tax=unclassified Nostoc TaxID=2593658 RepID=UPI001628271F|nr:MULTISPECIES: DUF2254 domain-containing protein [unclassified Nostoc]MBC1224919.1 DUF2254 domain-containing protein [Nostoc sp. UCD120]MBC1278203.1 DUF2254 domain-containing protein [Nostoc sp. UCD121]MBC1296007.1 DUF2254 domain-containing protein [Nostoc sp. UCD122]